MWGPSAGADGPLCAVGLAETGKPVTVALRADVARRMAIAEIVARVFPAHRKLVRDVEALFPELTKRWARRPYPADRLTYLSDRALRYRTPGQAEGLGTQGSLGKGAGMWTDTSRCGYRRRCGAWSGRYSTMRRGGRGIPR